ncbi:MerR family transcriptional regulator [Martelella sp.]|uniref:MerR family DNA-binding transcriptional regulator n=1 Tax=unclassified Martelella TaxID=2629616 RepID=UPI003459BAAF
MLIGDLARLSGLSKDGIRHYEEMGIVRSLPRQAGSRVYRDYDPANLDRIARAAGATARPGAEGNRPAPRRP